jgi:hypothetical protein
MMTRRHTVLLGLLLASAGLVAWDHVRAGGSTAIAGAVTHAHARRHDATAPTPATAAQQLAFVRERGPVDTSQGDDNAFAPLVTPRPPAAVAAPSSAAEAPPVPPPPPFTVIGKQLEQGRWAIFLSMADEPLVVHQGDVIAEHYRVESISPPTMTLTYLPLHQSQTMQIGAAFND